MILVLRRFQSLNITVTFHFVECLSGGFPVLNAGGQARARLVNGKVQLVILLFDLAVSEFLLPYSISFDHAHRIGPVLVRRRVVVQSGTRALRLD